MKIKKIMYQITKKYQNRFSSFLLNKISSKFAYLTMYSFLQSFRSGYFYLSLASTASCYTIAYYVSKITTTTHDVINKNSYNFGSPDNLMFIIFGVFQSLITGYLLCIIFYTNHFNSMLSKSESDLLMSKPISPKYIPISAIMGIIICSLPIFLINFVTLSIYSGSIIKSFLLSVGILLTSSVYGSISIMILSIIRSPSGSVLTTISILCISSYISLKHFPLTIKESLSNLIFKLHISEILRLLQFGIKRFMIHMAYISSPSSIKTFDFKSYGTSFTTCFVIQVFLLAIISYLFVRKYQKISNLK